MDYTHQNVFHSKYVDLLHRYCDLLSEKEDYEKIKEFSLKALEVDYQEERAHYWLIFSLVMQGKYSFAKKALEDAAYFLYNGDFNSMPKNR